MRDEADRREFPARYRRCEQVKAISVVFRPNANTVCQRLGACIATLSIKGIPEVSFWRREVGYVKEKLSRYDGSVSLRGNFDLVCCRWNWSWRAYKAEGLY